MKALVTSVTYMDDRNFTRSNLTTDPCIVTVNTIVSVIRYHFRYVTSLHSAKFNSISNDL